MNFDLSEEQEQLRMEVRRVLQKQCPTSRVREVLNGERDGDAQLWSTVAELGWMGLALPQAYGGSEVGHVELCIVAEEFGRALATLPFSSSIYLAAELMLAAGDEAQKSEWLPRLACGQIVATVAYAEQAGEVIPHIPAARVAGGKLNGCKIPVADGGLAELAIVLAADEEPGSSLYLVKLDEPTVERQRVRTLDPTRNFARLTFRNTKAERIGAAGQGSRLLSDAFDRAAVLLAFEQLGGAEAALEMARSYALERYAFGRPIGSFQAIKHRLADVYVATALARSNCYFGAWALAHGAAELPIAAAAARIGATQAYSLASTENIHVHGGMGFTWEMDAHLYYRRAKLLAALVGGEHYWKRQLIARLAPRYGVAHGF